MALLIFKTLYLHLGWSELHFTKLRRYLRIIIYILKNALNCLLQ